ncbi:Ubox [Seminavis robusta]|uniref:Ubox n=1 Tax=Seminavis robusta TaxID=568900 RepID=A0A9N8DF93_9STRA|nr:Ubox [Seminavis robusta]|eukprot:Sro121_g058970.1 Ubox (197) ;mRNA; r:79742-80332
MMKVSAITARRNQGGETNKACAMGTPPQFVCPITMEPMRYPMRAPGGCCFERAAILEWLYFGSNACHPLTRQPLHPDQLEADGELRQAIETWRRQHGVPCDTEEEEEDDDDEFFSDSSALSYHVEEANHTRSGCTRTTSGPAAPKGGSGYADGVMSSRLLKIRNRILQSKASRFQEREEESEGMAQVQSTFRAMAA